MAKVNLPLLSGHASGKLGDIVFFKRGSVQVARVRVKPANPNSEKQQIIRSNLKGLGELWRYAGQDHIVNLYQKCLNSDTGEYEYKTISVNAKDINKDSWKTCTIYSRSGFPLKGYQAFASVNLKRLMNCQGVANTPSDAGIEC